jgi:hypothetical protein
MMGGERAERGKKKINKRASHCVGGEMLLTGGQQGKLVNISFFRRVT